MYFRRVTYQSAQTGCTHSPSASDVNGALLVGRRGRQSSHQSVFDVMRKIQQAEAASLSPMGRREEGCADAPLGPGALALAEPAGGAVGEEGGDEGVGAGSAVLGGARLEEAEQLLLG